MNNFLSKKLTDINGCLTPYSVTLDKSRELIEEKAKLNPNFGNYIVLLSDGMPEGDVSSNAYKKSAEKITNHTLGIKFYTIGFNTTTTAANLLKSISSTPSSEYFKEAQNTDLSKIFEDIASSIE